MTSRALVIIILLGVSLSTSSGCSWAFVEGAPDAEPVAFERPPDCTSSRAAPVLDTLGVVGGGIMTASSLFGLARNWVSSEVPVLPLLWTIGSVGATSVFVVSANRGYRETKRCRRLRDVVRRLENRRAEP